MVFNSQKDIFTSAHRKRDFTPGKHPVIMQAITAVSDNSAGKTKDHPETGWPLFENQSALLNRNRKLFTGSDSTAVGSQRPSYNFV